MSKDYDTLILSGASTKGLLILGALQYAYDNNLLGNVSTYIGTSSGAMIGYLLAIGYTPIEIIVYLCTSQIMERILHFNLVAVINGDGATSFSPIQEVLEKMTIDKVGKYLTMKDIRDQYKKNLVCTTYNFTDEIVEYISADNYPDLPCLVALRMTANLPFIFPKFQYLGKFYIDGGIVDNFPVQLAGEKTLGCLVQADPTKTQGNEGILEEIYKLMFVPIHQSIEHKIKSSDAHIIRLSYPKLKFFNFDIPPSIKLEMFSLGYQSAKNFFIDLNKNVD